MWTPYNKAPSRKINLKVFQGAKMGLKHKNVNFFFCCSLLLKHKIEFTDYLLMPSYSNLMNKWSAGVYAPPLPTP